MPPPPFGGHPVFTILFCLLVVIWILPEIVFSKRRASPKPTRSQDKGSMIIIILSCYISLLLGAYLSISWLSATFSIHQRRMFLFGSVIWLIGIGLRWYAIATLGRYFTHHIAATPGQHLIDCGPYRYIRHPSYLGALLAALGFALTLNNWAVLLVVLVLQGASYGYRIYVEEAALAQVLGTQYANYVQRTKLLIPFLF